MQQVHKPKVEFIRHTPGSAPERDGWDIFVDGCLVGSIDRRSAGSYRVHDHRDGSERPAIYSNWFEFQAYCRWQFTQPVAASYGPNDGLEGLRSAIGAGFAAIDAGEDDRPSESVSEPVSEPISQAISERKSQDETAGEIEDRSTWAADLKASALDDPAGYPAEGDDVRFVAALIGTNLDLVPSSCRSSRRELPFAAEAIARTARYEASIELTPAQADALALVVAVGGAVLTQTGGTDGWVSVLLKGHGEEVYQQFSVGPDGYLAREGQDVREFGPQSLAAVAYAPDGVYDAIRQQAREEVQRRLVSLKDAQDNVIPALFRIIEKDKRQAPKQHKELEAIIGWLEELDCELVAAAREPGDEPFWTVLALRHRPVFKEAPYVIWTAAYRGLDGGHYDLDRESGFGLFDRLVAQREGV